MPVKFDTKNSEWHKARIDIGFELVRILIRILLPYTYTRQCMDKRGF